MTGVIYCRVSSKEQIEGTSLEVQEAACRDYARTNNLKVLRVFVEQGESAKFADRTQLLELIEFCRANKGAVQVLLVWKVDRFSRNVADHFSIKATLGKYGVQIVSVTEPIDAKPEGKLMETILAGFAQFDNDVRAMRTIQGMRRKIQDGIFPWGPPYGYKSAIGTGEKKTLPDIPDQPTFRLLQKAWKAYATGAYTQAETGRMMQDWGLMSAHGREFGHQFLQQFFTNPYYAGMLTDPWSGEQFQGKHIALVTREEFAQAQQVISRRNHSVVHQKERPEFPLRGLVRCDGCLHYLTGAFSRGRSQTYPYYVCHSKPCPKRGKSLAAANIHDDFEAFLDWITPKQQYIRELGDQIVQSAEQRRGDAETRNQRRRVRATQLDRELEELIRMRTQKLIADEDFLNQKKRLLAQRSGLEGHNQHEMLLGEAYQKLNEIMIPLANLRTTWHSLQPQRRRRFDRLLLPVGFITGKSRTADLGPLFSTNPSSERSNASGVPSAGEKLNRAMLEIQVFWEILNGDDEPERTPKRRFDNSHRNRLRWRKLNQGAE
jgi:site-specific DNA recombinase